jgi:hypothetical protein
VQKFNWQSQPPRFEPTSGYRVPVTSIVDFGRPSSAAPIEARLRLINPLHQDGLLSRMQVTNSGRTIWNEVFGATAQELYLQVPNDSRLKRALIFKANPTVKEVIFIGTPHRGSRLAVGGIGAIAIWLIRLPSDLLHEIPEAVADVFNFREKRPVVPTSIQGLSPNSPLLHALDRLPILAVHHSIIGDRGRGDTPNSSDGVVPYWSSHLASARSEKIVPTGHDVIG